MKSEENINSYHFSIEEKTEAVSFEQIAEVLHDAHRSNIEKGMRFASAFITGEEIREEVGEEGTIYLIRQEAEIAAVGAIKYRQWNKWFCKDTLCGNIFLVGVREKYKGYGLSKMMYHKLEEIIFQKCEIATMNTAVNNTIMLQSRLHDGWRYVDFFSHKGVDFYSIMLAKWHGQCPYSNRECQYRYLIRKALIKMQKKQNGEFRKWAKIIRRKR